MEGKGREGKGRKKQRKKEEKEKEKEKEERQKESGVELGSVLVKEKTSHRKKQRLAGIESGNIGEYREKREGIRKERNEKPEGELILAIITG